MQIIIYLFIGLISGLVSALCGVGGGIILVPIFVLLFATDQKTAVATSLAVIVPTAISACLNNVREDLIQWNIVIPVAVGAIIAAWFGSDLMHSLSNQTLKRIFAIILLATGFQMLIKSY